MKRQWIVKRPTEHGFYNPYLESVDAWARWRPTQKEAQRFTREEARAIAEKMVREGTDDAYVVRLTSREKTTQLIAAAAPVDDEPKCGAV